MVKANTPGTGTDAGRAIGPSDQRVPDDIPIDRTEWEARLTAARARREQVLKERAAAAAAQEAVQADEQDALAHHPDDAPTDPPEDGVADTAPTFDADHDADPAYDGHDGPAAVEAAESHIDHHADPQPDPHDAPFHDAPPHDGMPAAPVAARASRGPVLRADTRITAPVAGLGAEDAEIRPWMRSPVLWVAVGGIVGATIAAAAVSQVQRRAAPIPVAAAPTTPAAITATAVVLPGAPSVADTAPAAPRADATAAASGGIVAPAPVATAASLTAGDDQAAAPLPKVITLDNAAPPPAATPPEDTTAAPADATQAEDAIPDTADPETAAAMQALADIRPGRLVVQTPRNMAPERRDAALALLADIDWPSDGAVVSPFTISETHVRYYHAADRQSAQALANLFEGEARDFTNFRPSPNEGLVELWLSGKGSPRYATSRRRSGGNGSHAAAVAASRDAFVRFLNEATRAARRR